MSQNGQLDIDSKEKRTTYLSELKHMQRELNKDTKIKIDISKTQYRLLKTVAYGILGWRVWTKQNQKDDANIIWLDHYVTQQFVEKLKPYQRVNHFPASEQLGRKDYLATNLNNIKKNFPKQYNFYPKTWVLPQQIDNLVKFGKDNQQALFIVKPGGSCQGKGIYITKEIPQPQHDIIVQEYIKKPLLIEKMKFDFRLYVLLLSLNPLKIYVYREGLTRLATHDYEEPTANNIKDTFMHLTNYAINKNSPLYKSNQSEFQDNRGHKRTYSSIIQKLSSQGYNINQLQQKIDGIIIKTILSGYQKMLESYRSVRDIKQQKNSTCFEIYGFDIMITDNFEPKLIEVNHSPSFQADTPLDLIIKKYLLLDTLNMLNMNNQDKIDYLKKPISETSVKFYTQRLGEIKSRNFNETIEPRNLGGYRQIYPPLSTFNKYQSIIVKIIDKTNKPFKRSLPPFKRSSPLSVQQHLQSENCLKSYRHLASKFKERQTPYFLSSNDPQQYQDTFGYFLKEEKRFMNRIRIKNVNITFYGTFNAFQNNRQRIQQSSQIICQKPKKELNSFKQRQHQSQLKVRLTKLKLARVRIYRRDKSLIPGLQHRTFNISKKL